MEFVSDSAAAGGSGRGFRATYRLLPCGDAPTTSAPFTTPPGVTCGNYFARASPRAARYLFSLADVRHLLIVVQEYVMKDASL